MTEDDKFRIELHRSEVYYGDPLAADRIEELVEENKELTLQLLATSGQAADALDKLAKAVEALRFTDGHLAPISGMFFDVSPRKEIRTVLAELEKQ